jgi:hypothetical protein
VHGEDGAVSEELEDFKAEIKKLSAEFTAVMEKFKMTKDDLGKVYGDTVTGFKGPATAICFEIGGLVQVRIEPAIGEPRWIEESRLAEVVADNSARLTNPEKKL